MSSTVISIQNLNFFYKKKQVIFDFSLDIHRNKIFSIFGPANSGISTLFRSINRLNELTPSARLEGKIFLNDEEIHDKEVDRHDLRRKIGMVFDVPTPLPMSVYDNVAYGIRLQGGKSKKEINKIVEESLKMAALWESVESRLDISALALSGGQQQRLCIARVLALEPEVILLDRPCSGLDPISTAKIEDSLQKLKKRYTIVIAPHSIQQAQRISDRAAFMLEGKLIEEGSAEKIFKEPENQDTKDYIEGKFG